MRICDYLGQLTDEMKGFGSDSFIQEFVSVGHKNCAFSVFCHSTRKRTTKCNVKGISLNYENSKIVNSTILSDMILKNTAPVHVYKSKKIKRKHGGSL